MVMVVYTIKIVAQMGLVNQWVLIEEMYIYQMINA